MIENCMIIEVNGPHAEAEAKAIAKHYNTECEQQGDIWVVKANSDLEQALCIDEDRFNDAIEEITAATGVSINPDDISF